MSVMPSPSQQDNADGDNQKAFIETLVEVFQHATIYPAKKRLKQPDLVENYLKQFETWIMDAYHHYRGLSAAEGTITLTAEWVLDNHYILQQAFHLIEEDMPPAYEAQLPILTEPPYKNFPRIFALIRLLLYQENYVLNLEDLQTTLNDFQEQVSLTMGELWSIPIFIRFGLIEKLTYILAKDIKPGSQIEINGLPPILPENVFLMEAKPPIMMDNQTEIVGSIIRSLRVISETNWEPIFESISLVENTLRQDPAGIYPNMDFKTRNLYRVELEKIAKSMRKEECELAVTLLNLASEANSVENNNPDENQALRHIGTFLIGERREAFETEIGYELGLRDRVLRQLKAWISPLYLGSILLIATALIIIVLILTYQNVHNEYVSLFQSLLLFAFTLCLIPPAIIVASDLVNILVNPFLTPSLLPKLEFKTSIPKAYKTLVVIPGMISNRKDIENLVHQMEIHYLSNPQPGISFALLTDFPDADSETRPEDEDLVSDAFTSVANLSQKYQQEGSEGDHRFFLFHRKRLWNPVQGKWMGWERKRGKLHELGRFLRGADDTSFLVLSANEDVRQQLASVRYVITVDADTLLLPGSAVRLIGTMAHPLNRARFDPVNGKVVSGYTILQPRIEINPRSANQTWFSRIFAGDTGLDLYSHAVSDIYQDLFGEGIYVGKGIYDVDAMMRSVECHIPENTLLSHDLLEGILGRAGLISDITLIEDYPQNYYEQVVRKRRWIRGDWQLLPWLINPSKFGVQFSSINKWKIFHNLLRSLLSPALMIVFFLGVVFVPSLAWLWILILTVSFGVPLISALGKTIKQTWQSMVRKAVWPSLWSVFMRWLFAIAFLPYEAYYTLDAILITLRRLFFTKRELLTWTTSEHASQLLRSKTLQKEAWTKLSISAILVVGFLLIAELDSFRKGETTFLTQVPVLLIISLWLMSSALVRIVNQRIPNPRRKRPFKDISFLRQIAYRTWTFFENFVGPQDHWLPPDHFQESPKQVIAHHTSPSNIGLFLTSAIGAYDLGYFDQLGLAARLETTVHTLTQMERHRGHFLNWYNTQTLDPLKPRYVSTVDSGNLAISLVIVSQTCKEIPKKRVFRREIWEGYMDNLTALAEVLSGFKRTHPTRRTQDMSLSITNMLRQIRSIKNYPLKWYPTYTYIGSTFWPNLSKNLVEFISNLPSKFDIEDITLLQGVIQSTEKNYDAIQNTIDKLVPWIPYIESIPDLLQQDMFRDTVENLKTVLTYNPFLFQISQLVPGVHELINQLVQDVKKFAITEDYSDPSIGKALTWLEGLQKALLIANENAIQLQDKYKELDKLCGQLIEEMDFRFLYSSARNLFHLGFNLETGQLDNNYYDLLASEARIASIFSISRGHAPLSHWMHLGRPITRVNGGYALLSWSATMFEYLMPALYFQPHVNTLQYKSIETMVNYQRAYAQSKNTPWGISESGFYQFDTNTNYQYRAFGVPALGFKRGLGDDLVIAPYASLMAIKWAPSSVEENAQDLISHDAFGPFGFYESIDFTQSRLRPGKKFEVIREYMSHHQGMILMALVNYLRNDIMVRRVLQDAQLESVELLLQEQIPTGIPLLMPSEEETRGTRRESDFLVQVEPWEEPVTSQRPRMHLLSNGNFTTMLSNWGGGFSRWEGIDLTRWHADGVLEPWGTWIYIQDLDKKKGDSKFTTWSAADQPIPGNPDNSQVNFFAHMAVFTRTQHDLTSTMEVTVAPDDPLEIRRIHLINNASLPRHLRFTSYGEVILNTLAADTRHPAYNNLFIESEFVPELNLLIFKDRRRRASKQPVFLGHMLVIKEPRFRRIEPKPVCYETDRRTFVGRDRNLRDPEALQSKEYLTGTTGSTLNPIFSLGREIHLRPHETFSLAYITFTAPSKTALLRMAERYSVWTQIDDAFYKSNISNLAMLGRQKIDREELKSSLDLLSLLVYPLSQKRADPATLAKNVLNQAGLWRFGISGDYPIILLEIDEFQQLNLLIEVIQAQSFLRTYGYQTDLVILNTQPSMYSSELYDMIIRRIRLIEADQWLNQRAGIFIRSADQMRMEEQILLRSIARVSLKGNHGSLAEQLRVTQKPASDLPQLFTSLRSRRNLPPTGTDFSELKSGLQFYNGYGGFSPDGREYVLILPPGKTTPAPWINVIGYPKFGFMVSQSGSQTTWAINSGENRISPWSNDPVSDPSGEVLYLRDEESGDIWSPTPLPASAGQTHLVRHGAGYSVFESESHGLRQEMTVFASPEDPVKIVHLKLYNSLNENRRITATYYLEWVLGSTREDTNAMLIPEYSPNYSMLSVRNPYHSELGNQIVFLMSNCVPHGFTTDRMEFLGSRGSTADPAALHRIGLSNNVALGIDSCAAMQLHLDMDPNGEDELYFVVGAANDEEHLDFLAKKYHEKGAAAATLEKTNAFWENILTRIQVSTPDPAADLMLNRWWLYQALSCRIWGRSGFYQSGGAFGFRDQLQDVLALLNIDASITREQILNAAKHQFEEGDVLHWWHPPTGRGVRTRISDNLIWLPYVTSHYASTTGDSAIWDQTIPFLKAPLLKPDEIERYAEFERTSEVFTIFEHCQRALRKGCTTGSHGLPLIGSGDWNDGFNMVGGQGRGESIWLAWFLIDTLMRFAKVCEHRGMHEEAINYRKQADSYRRAIEEHAWDGEWYLRAFYDDGTPLGSRLSEACQIDAIAQSWSVISEVGDRQRSEQAMNKVWERLTDTNNNLSLLFTPPFDETANNPGYISYYPPGVRENGGQYTHAAAWTAWAYAKLGDSQRAWHLFDILNPIYQSDREERVNQYRVEPYVSAADIYSQGAKLRRGGWTWYTGSAGWLYRVGIEALLGLRRESDLLYLDPIIPSRWDGFTIRYRYLDTMYQMEVRNPDHVTGNIKERRIDGKIDAGREIQLVNDGIEHKIELLLGD